jgi:hypothetical protein
LILSYHCGHPYRLRDCGRALNCEQLIAVSLDLLKHDHVLQALVTVVDTKAPLRKPPRYGIVGFGRGSARWLANRFLIGRAI